eukprot:PhF_6_TR10848/c0_g1_i1/m.17543/K19684/CLUAP1, DYF3; clusterin-associated protein 1
MSFRELRDFTESLRQLGYPRQVSIESFRKPNFELVADILNWLTLRLDPSSTINFQIEREKERINFLRQCNDVVSQKARLSLNMRRVYQADGYAARELLRLSTLLRDAMRAVDTTHPSNIGDSAVDDITLTQLVSQITSTSPEARMQEAKALRQLTAEITQQASGLYALYGAENTMRQRRLKVVNKHTDMGEVEKRIRELVTSLTQRTEALSETLTNLQADEKNLEQKMDTKRAQLERQQKRLKALQAVRPAFMEEYEKQEGELQRQYGVYLEQYRNLEYLENELSKCTKLEDALLAEQEVKLRLLREKLRKEELKALRGEAIEQGENDMDMLGTMTEGGGMSESALEVARQAAMGHGGVTGEGSARPRAASGRQRPSTKDGAGGSAQGGMGGGGPGGSNGGGGRGGPSSQTKPEYGSYGGGGGQGDDETDSELDDLDDDDDDDGNHTDDDDDDVSADSSDLGAGDDDDDDDLDSNDS